MKLNRKLISNRPLRYLVRLLLWSPVLFIFLPIILDVVTAVCPGLPRSVGYCTAKFDTLREHYELKSNGLPSRWWRDHVGSIPWQERRAWENRHRDVLQERYGIRAPGWQIGSCVEFQFIREYRRGYDQTQRAAIARKFGQNAIVECALEVSEEMKIKPPPSPFDEPHES